MKIFVYSYQISLIYGQMMYDNPKFNDEFEKIQELNIKVKEAINLSKILGDGKKLFGESHFMNQSKAINEENKTQKQTIVKINKNVNKTRIRFLF